MTLLGGSAVIETLNDPPQTPDDTFSIEDYSNSRKYQTGLNLSIAKLTSLFNPIVDKQRVLGIGVTQ